MTRRVARAGALTLLAVSAFTLAGCAESAPGIAAPEVSEAKGGINAHPKFQYSNYSTGAMSLSNAIKQTGLGNFSVVNYVFSASFQATYNCRNKSGHLFPQSVPWYREYTFPTTPISIPPNNGQVTHTFTLTMIDPNNDPNAPECGDGPAARQWSWALESGTAKWTNIKFCWGQATTMQGPVPGGIPGAAANYIMYPYSNAAGGPLTGDMTAGTGIFSTSCRAASLW